MRKLKDLSIKKKLIIIQLITVFLILLFFGIFLIYYDYQAEKKSISNKLNSLAQVIGTNSISSLVFFDNEASEQVLLSLDSEEQVKNAWIYDSGKKLFAKYSKPGFSNYSFPLFEGPSEMKGNFSVLSNEIIHDNERIGTVYFRVEISQLYDKIKSSIIMVFIVMSAGMFIALLFSVITQKTISEPILKLVETTKRISESGDYSIRVKKLGSDEIGMFYDSFNHMLEQIRLRKKERDNAEKALRESEEKFYKAFYASPDSITINLLKDGRFIDINKGFTNITGYKSKETFGKSALELNLWLNPEQREEYLKILKKQGEIHNYEFDLLKKTGEIVTCLLSSQVVELSGEKCDISVVKNISDRKKAEKELTEQHNLLKALINTLPEVIYVKNTEHKFILGNKAFSHRYGVEIPEKLYGLTDFDLGSYEDARKNHDFEEKLLQSGKSQLKKIDIEKDEFNNKKWFNNSKIPFTDNEGKIIGLVGVVQDITEIKLAEEKLRKAHDELEEKVADRTRELAEANVRLQELDKLKSMFLASMSHELRTPLNSIIGFTGLLLMGMTGELNEEQKKQLNLVKNSANHLLSLINDILDISKIESGKIDLLIEEFEIFEIVDNVAATVSTLAKDKGLELKVECPQGIKLKSDKRRAKQILMNLVSNAVKFTEQGIVNISVEKLNSENLKITVADTGIGIKEEDINKLFLPFQQVDMSSTKKHEGTGLGLHLCKKLTALLHGDISLKSEYGKGSEFKIILPFKLKLEVQ